MVYVHDCMSVMYSVPVYSVQYSMMTTVRMTPLSSRNPDKTGIFNEKRDNTQAVGGMV